MPTIIRTTLALLPQSDSTVPRTSELSTFASKSETQALFLRGKEPFHLIPLKALREASKQALPCVCERFNSG